MASVEDARSDLLARCRDPGFTPGAKDVAKLLGLWEDARASADDRSKSSRELIAKALARGDIGVVRALLRGLRDDSGLRKAFRIRVLSRLGRRLAIPELESVAAAHLRDPEPRVVREAVRVLSKLDERSGRAYEPELLRILDVSGLPEQRAVVEALGRVGGEAAREQLERMNPDDDDLRRRSREALTLLDRRKHRVLASRVLADVRLHAQAKVILRCRAGAAAVVRDQVAARLAETAATRTDASATEVTLAWTGNLASLMQIRSALEVALSFPLPPADTLVDRVVSGLAAAPLIAALAAWTDGPIRFRLGLSGSGPQRAVVWEVAQRLRASGSPLVNDSRQANWSVEIDASTSRILCVPRGADDRFGYRKADVPAASHPTLAALLAWVAAPSPRERIWDPFCGSGSELIECAMLQPGLHLLGSDLDAKAVAAAHTNLAAAAITTESVRLRQTDALADPPPGPISLIITNPPMGRRVAADGPLRQVLTRFIDMAAARLAPRGRLVWLSPLPRLTLARAIDAGLRAEDRDVIDMGGFTATVQRLRKGPF